MRKLGLFGGGRLGLLGMDWCWGSDSDKVNVLIMFLAQSNGDGRGTTSDASGNYPLTASNIHIWQAYLKSGVAGTGNDDQDYDNIDSNYEWATMDVANNTNCQPNAKKQDNQTYGMFVSLAKELSDYTGRDTYIIKAAWSGTTINAHRVPNGYTPPVDCHRILEDFYITPALADLRAQGKDLVFYPMIAMQGESDMDATRAANWPTYAKEKANDLRSLDTALADLPIIVGRIYATATGYADSPHYPTLRTNQAKFTFIDNDSRALNTDGLHFTGPAQEAMGVDFFNAIKDFPSDNTAPTLVSLTVEDEDKDILVVKFNKDIKDTPLPANTAYSLTGDESSITVSSSEVIGPHLYLTLSGDITGGSDFGLSYSKTGTNDLQSWKGHEVVSFTGQDVTNNVSTGFDLSSYPGYWASYDASDAANMTKDGSDKVSQWDDLSGNGRHFEQSDSTRQMTWNSAGYIEGDGSNDLMEINPSSGTGLNFTEYTIYIRAYIPTGNGNARLICSRSNASPRVELYLDNSSGNVRQYISDGTNNKAGDSANPTYDAINSLVFQFEAGVDEEIEINGTEYNESATAVTGSIDAGRTLLTGLTVNAAPGGYHATSSFYGDFRYYKLAIFSDKHTDTQKSEIISGWLEA